jgi:hypothetical protein
VTAFLRRAGAGTGPDGAVIVWSVAEGHRGRRWREVVRTGEGIRSSLLLELDPDCRFSHLELSTAAGLLTLHPEGGGTLHGNAVTSAGIGHVVGLPWQADVAIWLDGSGINAAAARRADGTFASDCLRIGLDLTLAREAMPVDPGAVDPEGLPVLAGGTTWPLEENH